MGKAAKTPPVIRSTTQLARYVGLSRSVVWRVLNVQPHLRPDTVERVQRALAETGFTPNAHALHLRGKPTAVIGVCMENFLTPTAVSKLSVLQELLAPEGYTTLAEMNRPGAYDRVVRHFLSLRVEGVVFIGHFPPGELAQRLAELERHATPHVVVDNTDVSRARIVTLDRAEAMRQVVAHLCDLGHRRFGLLGLSGPFQTVVDRLRGVHDALRQRGLEPARCTSSHDERFERTDHFEFGRTLAASFATEPRLPSAFIAVNDETAVGALLEFQSRGLRVPEDVSVVGFNNQNLCLMTRPRLTSVDQQIEETMRVTVAQILGGIRRPARRPSTTLIAPQLVLRGSTGPAPRRR